MISIRTHIQGWTDYLPWFRNLARSAPANFLYVEVGPWKGQSVLALADCLAEYRRQGRIVAVDPVEPADLESRRLLHENIRQSPIPITIDWNTRHLAARSFPDERADTVFLDAAHKYQSLRRDLEAWWPKVKPGGILAGHDYRSPHWVDVCPTVDRWAAERGLTVNFEPPQVWWVQKPGGAPWFQKSIWDVDVQIPHDHATNPGVERDPVSGKLAFVFRTTSFGWGHGRLWMATLDEKTMQLAGPPSMLWLGDEELNYEDPRLFIHQGQLWLVATISEFAPVLKSRMGIAPVQCAGGAWEVTQPLRMFASPDGRNQEKNWTFLSREEELLTLYSMEPWSFRACSDLKTEAAVSAGLPWPYGQPRGGSQFFEAAPGRLWAFFHSSSNRRYVAGLVEIDAVSLQPLRISERPLFDDEDLPASWNGHQVLWVGGATRIGEDVLVAYGKNDHSCHLRRESLAALESTLRPV